MENSRKQKGTAFVVEVIKKDDDSRLFVVRTPQGEILSVLDTPDQIATFFNECEF